MESLCITIGILRNNTYILYSAQTGKGVVVDPAGKLPELKKLLEEKKITPVAVLLTHGHFDHIMGLGDFLAAFPVPVIAAEKECPLLADQELNMTRAFHMPQSVTPDRAVREGESLEFPGFSLKVLETPGHTRGSVCYYSEEDGVLISGDTLFENSCGRTDFPTGDPEAMENSLRRLFLLPPETRVLPGHGRETAVGTEKARQMP